MSLTQALIAYLSLNLFVIIGYVGLRAVARVMKAAELPISANRELGLHYAIFCVTATLVVMQPFFPKNEIFHPVAKVWSAASLQALNGSKEFNQHDVMISFTESPRASQVPVGLVVQALLVLIGSAVLFGVVRLGKDLWLLRKIRRSAFLVKRIGRVHILAHDSVAVPFSFWIPVKAYVVVPTCFLAEATSLKIAIQHELQHHRNRDTRWVYLLGLLRLICLLNPAVHLWNRWISELQEFACDEALVDRKKVESQEYARCLFQVATTALSMKNGTACAAGLNFLTQGPLLKRRIERMLHKKIAPQGTNLQQTVSVFILVAIASIMTATAYATNGTISDRRVTMSEAKDMAKRADQKTGFPIVVNESVLKQLNRYVGTPEGRAFVRDSLLRMQAHKPAVKGTLDKYKVPAEILAVPLVESGYQNLSEGEGAGSMKSAGLWQFIPTTARNFGLKVDAKADERLDVLLSTDAAMRYLLANYVRFKDWQLSLLAYNIGEGNVQKGIQATGSRDAWVLIEKGYEGDKDYLAKVMAAIIILQNPDSL